MPGRLCFCISLSACQRGLGRVFIELWTSFMRLCVCVEVWIRTRKRRGQARLDGTCSAGRRQTSRRRGSSDVVSLAPTSVVGEPGSDSAGRACPRRRLPSPIQPGHVDPWPAWQTRHWRRDVRPVDDAAQAPLMRIDTRYSLFLLPLVTSPSVTTIRHEIVDK